MNQKGEYVLNTMCPFCKNKPIMDKYGSPGCIDIEKDKCTRFEKDTTQSENSTHNKVKIKFDKKYPASTCINPIKPLELQPHSKDDREISEDNFK